MMSEPTMMTQYTTEPQALATSDQVERDLLDLLERFSHVEQTIGRLDDYGAQFDVLTWLATGRAGVAEALHALAVYGGPS